MVSFPSSVSGPGGTSYSAPLIDFGVLGNLYNSYQQSQLTEQEKQLRALALQKQQQDLAQQQQLRTLFQGGLPTKDGQLDYQAITQALAKAGDINAIPALAPLMQQQAAGQVSPLFSGGTPPAAASPAPATTGPRGDLPPASAVSGARTSAYTGGDQGTGTVASIVAEKYGDAAPETGRLMSRISMTMGIDPNQPLTAGQQRRAQGLLARYGGAPNIAPAPSGAPAEGAPAPAGANPMPTGPAAALPLPPVVPSLPPAQGAPAAVPPSASSAAGAAPQGQPIIPPVPLPKGYSDPGVAAQALRAEAARLSSNPYAAGQVKALNDWAGRIEGAQQPLTVQPGQRIVNPATGQTVYSSPERPISVGGNLVRPDTGEVVYRTTAADSTTRDADANLYRKTGKFPPNMGRGVQGQAEAQKIRERAVEQEINEGGDPNEWPARWQGFATHAAGLRTLETRAANLTLVEEETKTLIPRVREASKKVSRTEYPDLNKIILSAQQRTGGKDVIQFGIAVESLIPVYARLLKPTGVIGVTDTENARHILNKAWSDGQIDAALDQMEIERKSAKDALAEARKSFGQSTPDRREIESPAPSVIKWEKGGDGVLRPVQQ